MEERVGQLWDRLITRAARRDFPEAAVALSDVATGLAIFYRGLGGDIGHRLEPACPTLDDGRRGWLERLAASGRRVQLGYPDDQALRLPGTIAWFSQRCLNRDLYYWLAALFAQPGDPGQDWLVDAQGRSQAVLERLPGMRDRYRRLSLAHIALRPDPDSLHGDEAFNERAVRAALTRPGSVLSLRSTRRPPATVPLWPHPLPPVATPDSATGMPETPAADSRPGDPAGETRRRAAERVEMPDGKGGLITVRMENIFSWSEYLKVDRSCEEDEDTEDARRTADDMQVMSVARDARSAHSRVRFDLDLPSAEHDDHVLEGEILLPEWDSRHQRMRADHCRLQRLLAAEADPCPLPPHLNRMARRLRAQLELLAPARHFKRGETDGQEVDLEAYLRFAGDRLVGGARGDAGLYRSLRTGQRDLACLLLADLSLSTDTWVNNDARVIDVIRDSLFLFAESLAGTGDRFALYGFSSKKREHVRFHHLKGFTEPYGAAVRGRIQVIKPGYYTRMGAAIRHACSVLSATGAGSQLLVLLSDGKPNDLDQYEGRYGIEDTRAAIIEARREGIRPFCVTIDEKASDYLPHLFGAGGFTVIRRPAELPGRLPGVYAQLTR